MSGTEQRGKVEKKLSEKNERRKENCGCEKKKKKLKRGERNSEKNAS